jgi:nitrogen fixation protein NifU and related proteins
MSEDIYQNQILEWSKRTDHTAGLENVHCRATVSNPLCGDRISVELELDGDVIKSMAFQARGCLLCKASGSILAERVSGLGIDELKGICSRLEGALKASDNDPESFPEGYNLFFPVRLHKSRHSCVLLPFQAVITAVSEYRDSSDKKSKRQS